MMIVAKSETFKNFTISNFTVVNQIKQACSAISTEKQKCLRLRVFTGSHNLANTVILNASISLTFLLLNYKTTKKFSFQ